MARPMLATSTMYSEATIEERLGASRFLVEDLARELRDEQGEIAVEETPTAWLLAGRDVYEVKKPLCFPFVDLSSPTLREAACRRELDVNRRLAPRTYRAVVPIRRALGGRATLSGRGPVIDWAVQRTMQDRARRGDAMLADKQLGPDTIDRLASTIAAFHADAPTSREVGPWGSASVVLAHVLENTSVLHERGYGFVTVAEAQEIEARQVAFLRAHEDLFEYRVRGGFVRDCHGDLRLEHVFVQPDGDVEIVEAVDFEPSLRCADVCADVAFLAMDIARSGRVDLTERFLARYARATNDYDLYRLVDFYETYRALLRARLDLFAAKPRAMSHEARAQAEASVRRHLLLALSTGRRALLTPGLVVVTDPRGDVAEHIADELAAPLLDGSSTQGGAAEVWRRADVVLGSGRPVVVSSSDPAPAAAVAEKSGVTCSVIRDRNDATMLLEAWPRGLVA